MPANPFSRIWQRLTHLCRKAAADENAAQFHYDRGNAHSSLRQFAQAESEFHDVVALQPGQAEAHYRLGIALQDQRRYADAAASYRNAVAARPDHVRAHNNLGAVLQMQEMLPEALASFQRAVDLAPAIDQPYLNLGRLQAGLGDPAGAARSYRLAIERGIEPAMFRHLLNAVEGVTTERAPVEFSRAVFDHFAETFDERLLAKLDYRIPQILGAHIVSILPSGDSRVLDVGCGTGLCAEHLKGHTRNLVGLDLSPLMLEKARDRGIYDELVECDIVEYLAIAPAMRFDAVVAADVFIYLGNLAGIFRDVARTLANGGVFAFSIEISSGQESDFVLKPSGHYAQTESYIRRIAGANGLQVAEAFAETIRSGHDHVANGHVFVLVKP